MNIIRCYHRHFDHLPVDTTPPTITGCPSDQEVVIELGEPGGTASWPEPTASDLSGVAQLIVRSAEPGSFFLVQDTLVTYTFVDNANNEATCQFTVTVTPGLKYDVYAFSCRHVLKYLHAVTLKVV